MRRFVGRELAWATACAAWLAISACSVDVNDPGGGDYTVAPPQGGQASGATGGSVAPLIPNGTAGAAGGGAGSGQVVSPGPQAGASATAGTGATGGMGAGGTGGVPVGGAGTGGSAGATEPAGPDDGDPNAPIVTTSEVACGGPGGFGGSANFQLGGRDMIVTYPCDKHAGAPMIFFLNLHGTTPVDLHFYQHGYFAAHTLAASHNLIVVTPSSVVEQWGNGDGGEDEPHLMAIIDWVYATFHGDGKFDIRAMWVGGHSWGAMYTTTFVCKPYLADKVKGAVIMSGIGANPACASSISVISTAAESDIGPVVNQGNVPMTHGCDASQMNMITNNEEAHWPNCDPGFVHANYFMLGKSHTSSIDREVVERIANLMKEARP